MLIECPECNMDVSDRADACPQCGFPLADESQTPRMLDRQRAEEADHEKHRSELESLDDQMLFDQALRELGAVNVHLEHPKTYAVQRRAHCEAAYLYSRRTGSETVPTEDFAVDRDRTLFVGHLSGDRLVIPAERQPDNQCPFG